MSIEELRLLNDKVEEDMNSSITSHNSFVKKVRQEYEEVRNKFIGDNRKFPNGYNFICRDNNSWEIQLVHFSEETGFEYTVQNVEKNWEGYFEQNYFTEAEIEGFILQDNVENLILEKCNKLRFLFDEYVNSCKRIEEEFNEKINKLQR